MPAAPVRRRASRETVAWGLVIALLAALAIVATLIAGGPRAGGDVLRLAVLPPANAIIDDDETAVRVSPDGRSIVFSATDSSGTSSLWVRDLAEAEARPLRGTEQATLPFWSPDSRSIGFFADQRLKRIEAGGRNVQVVCVAPDGRGGAWSPRGVIVFAPASVGGLMRVAEGGGTPVALTAPDTARHERSHRFPGFLPDGRKFLYVALAPNDVATRVASLDDPRPRTVLTNDQVALYATPGHLLFVRSGNLLAQRFDPGSARLSGEPRVIGPALGFSTFAGTAAFSVSATGVVVQRHRAPSVRGLAWLDRQGHRIGEVPVAPEAFQDLTLAPDNRQVAITRLNDDNSGEIWTIDTDRGIATRFTFDRPFCEKPCFSPDGRWIAFSSLEKNGRNIYRRLASGAGGPERLVTGRTGFGDAAGWTPDGRTLLFRDLDPTTGEDIWKMNVDGDRTAVPVLNGTPHEEDASLSPDGRWLAYRSNESGRAELYVQSFPAPDERHRISTDGAGTGARSTLGKAFWRRDGHELVYVGGDGVTVRSVPVDVAGGFHAGVARTLFHLPAGCAEMVATTDLQRFLVLEERSTKESASIQLLSNWPAALTKR
jgi:Tol biopolymer transport system component